MQYFTMLSIMFLHLCIKHMVPSILFVLKYSHNETYMGVDRHFIIFKLNVTNKINVRFFVSLYQC